MKEVDEATDAVIKLSKILGPTVTDFREFRLEGDRVFGWTVYKDDDLHCVKSFMSKGAEFPFHKHEDSVETLTLIEGEAEITSADGEGNLVTQSFIKRIPIYLNPGANHRVSIKENSVIFAVFLPPDKDFE